MIKAREINVTVNGEKSRVWQIDNDINGNERYVVHFCTMDVSLNDYMSRMGKDRKATKAGLKVYRAKWFGGGYVFQANDLEGKLNAMYNEINKED